MIAGGHFGGPALRFGGAGSNVRGMRPQARDISNLKPPVTVIEWVGDARGGHLRLLDQTKLPARTAFVD